MQDKKRSAPKPVRNAALRLGVLCVLLYSITYICRKSFDANINEIMDLFGQGKATVGLIGTFYFAAYAVGQVFHGIMCKFYRPRSVLFGMGMAVAILTLLMGVVGKEGFAYLKYIWLLNGFACASFWSVIVLTLNRCVAAEHKSKVMFLTCFPVSVGTFMSYGLSSLFSFLHRFRMSFILSALAMTVVSVYWLIRCGPLMDACLAEKAEKDGTIESGSTITESHKRPGSLSRQFIGLFACLAIFAIINNLIRDGLNTWTPTILKDSFGMENWLSVLLSVLLPLMHMFGSVLSLALYRKNKNYFVLCGGQFFAAALILLVMLSLFNSGSWVITLLCLVLVSLLMASINSLLTSIFPLNVEKGINAGTVAGLIDGFCYVGSAISSYGIGSMTEFTGSWNSVFVLLSCLAAFCTVLSLGSLFVRRRNKRTEP